jgi:capsular exopolysaccharide synthesis family protein
MLSKPGAGPKVLLVPSSVPGEGKTTLSANLACVFAQHNKKVWILEADLRRPRMSTLFGVGNEVGLSNVLTGGATVESAIVRGVELPGLDLLPAGPVPPLPSEILDSHAFDQLLSELRERYDLVVIDSPPATIVTDPIPLAIKSDGVIWISRSGTATRPLVTRSAEIVRKYRLPLIGFVMNGINLRSVDYRYTYYGHNGESGYYDDSRA